MFKACFLSAFFLAVFFFSRAQSDTVRKFLDENLRFTTKSKAVYGALSIRQGDHWVLYAVYPDTTVLLKIYYRNAALTVKDGAFTVYHPKRVVAQQGFFKDNVPNGPWEIYYPSGKPKSAGTVYRNHMVGPWKFWYENGQLQADYTYMDSSKVLVYDGGSSMNPADNKPVIEFDAPTSVKEGPAKTWYQGGGKESELQYANDSLYGACTWYYENGAVSSKETYEHGKLTDLSCYDSTGKYTGATCSISKLPVLVHPIFTAQEYFADALQQGKYKDVRTGGDVQISFTIAKSGKPSNLVIMHSPDPALSKHVTDIFAAMPAWSPAVSHNRPIDFPMQLVIPYY